MPTVQPETAPERWRIIPSFPLYEASTQGRIRRVGRGMGATPGRVLRPATGPSGYQHLNLGDGHGNARTVSMHVAVAQAWLGPRPGPEFEVDHIDNNRENNRVDNLQYVTKSRNNALAVSRGRRHSGFVVCRGEENPKAKLTAEQVAEIRRRYRFGVYGAPRLAREYGVTHQTISAVVNRRIWRHVA